jgi:hypothetical protein
MTFELFRDGVTIEPEITAAEAEALLGRYRFEPANHEWTVLIQHGRLAINVPGEMVYELHRPDDEGWRVFRAIEQFKVRFERDGEDSVTGMTYERAGTPFALPRIAEERTDDRPSLAEVQRLVEQAHGIEAWRDFETVRYLGEMQLVHQGISGRVTVSSAGADRYLEQLDFGKLGSIRVCVDGDRGWTDMSWNAAAEPLGEEELATARSQHPAVMFTGWDTVFDDVRVVGRAMRDKRDVILVELDLPNGPKVELSIDAATGLVVAASGMMHASGVGNVPFTARFEDHRTVKGMTLPHRIVTENAVAGRTVLTVERVEVDTPLSPDAFTLPRS